MPRTAQAPCPRHDPFPVALCSALALALWLTPAPGAQAQQQGIPAEVFDGPDARVTFYRHAFLTDEEVEFLRIIASNPDARATMMGDAPGFAAIAIAPREGFLAGTMPAPSAHARAQLPDRDSAHAAARAGCDAARSGGAPCVVVIDTQPAR